MQNFDSFYRMLSYQHFVEIYYKESEISNEKFKIKLP